MTGCDKKQPVALPYLFEGDVILAFGDSLTYGTGANQDQSYPAILSALSNRKVINAGVPGETTAGGLKRLPQVLKASRPSLVLLCLGGNDFLKKVPPTSTRNNLESMINLIKSEGIPVVLLGVPRPGLGLKSDALYAELSSRFQVALIEDVISDVLGDRDLKSDPVHPNARGYSQMAKGIFNKLSELGAL